MFFCRSFFKAVVGNEPEPLFFKSNCATFYAARTVPQIREVLPEAYYAASCLIEE